MGEEGNHDLVPARSRSLHEPVRDIERPAPGTLSGPRVVVRPYVDSDTQALYEGIISSREHLQPWFPWVSAYSHSIDALTYIRQCQSQALLRQDFQLGMFTRAGDYLGGTGIHVHDWRVPAFEIGYWVRKEAEGQGYVGEAVRLQTTFAFEEMGAQRVMIRCNARNNRSRRVAERTGFVHEGQFRNAERDTGNQLVDILYFAMVPGDFETARQRWGA